MCYGCGSRTTRCYITRRLACPLGALRRAWCLMGLWRTSCRIVPGRPCPRRSLGRSRYLTRFWYTPCRIVSSRSGSRGPLGGSRCLTRLRRSPCCIVFGRPCPGGSLSRPRCLTRLWRTACRAASSRTTAAWLALAVSLGGRSGRWRASTGRAGFARRGSPGLGLLGLCAAWLLAFIPTSLNGRNASCDDQKSTYSRRDPSVSSMSAV